MGREYEQLTLEERHALFRLHAAGTAVGAIAAAASRTPTACYAVTCPGTPPCPAIVTPTSMPGSGRSTPRRANASPFRPPWRPSPCNSVSRLKCESTAIYGLDRFEERHWRRMEEALAPTAERDDERHTPSRPSARPPARQVIQSNYMAR